MSIGKDAIRRVENNGYSHVETHAPDMENSVVESVVESVTEPVAEPEKRDKRSPRGKPPQKDGFVRVRIGEKMPVWLL